MKNGIKRLLAVTIACVCFLSLFNGSTVYAAMVDEALDYELGETYTGSVEGGGSYKYYKFIISDKSHVTFYLTKHKLSYTMENPSVDVFNSAGKNILPDEDINWKYNGAKDVYFGQQYRVLGKGTYYIRFYYTGGFSLRIQAEKQISFENGAIVSLSSPKKGQMSVKCKLDKNAIGYRITIATNEKFTKNKKVEYSQTPSKTIENLKQGTCYYVKVCPYTVYDDGTRVFGQNSLVKTIRLKK